MELPILGAAGAPRSNRGVLQARVLFFFVVP